MLQILNIETVVRYEVMIENIYVVEINVSGNKFMYRVEWLLICYNCYPIYKSSQRNRR